MSTNLLAEFGYFSPNIKNAIVQNLYKEAKLINLQHKVAKTLKHFDQNAQN